MFRIKKRFEFSASHSLLNLGENHPCTRMHGHNYQVWVKLKSTPGSALGNGMLVDYRKLSDIKQYIDEHLDHRHLNDILPQPTAELIAFHLFTVFSKMHPEVYAVTVQETDKTAATYSKD